jgi:hypothetical protein
MGSRELGDLLPEGSQVEDSAFRLRFQAYSIKVATVVAQVQIVSLVKDAKLLVLAQVGRPLGRLGTAAPMVLVGEEVAMVIPPGWHGMKMAGFTSDGHGSLRSAESSTSQRKPR